MSSVTKKSKPDLKIRIATRKSQLAVWQAEFIGQKIKENNPKVDIEYVPLSTKGDEVLDRSLSEIGGKGVFVKNLEQALLDDKADIAVHSLKDVPCNLSEIDERFALCMFSEREEPYDVLITNNYKKLDELSKSAVIGTSSPRRSAQLRELGFKNIKLLRGNVARRVQRLTIGEYDAIVLAYAGLIRLKIKSLADDVFSVDQMTPAPGQGVMAVECLSNRKDLIKLFKKMDNLVVKREVSLERKITAALDGDCHSPIGMFAKLLPTENQHQEEKYEQIDPDSPLAKALLNKSTKMQLTSMIASANPNSLSKPIHFSTILNDQDPKEVEDVINHLISQGAKKLLKEN